MSVQWQYVRIKMILKKTNNFVDQSLPKYEYGILNASNTAQYLNVCSQFLSQMCNCGTEHVLVFKDRLCKKLIEYEICF